MKNVLLITVDSLRADYVFGPRAPDGIETLSTLAAEGVTYANAFSNAAYTKPSFLSTLSGTYPWMFDSIPGGFGPDRPHVAEILSDAGYATGGFLTNPYLSPTWNYDRGFDHYLGRGQTETERELESVVNSAFRSVVDRAIAADSQVVETVYRTFGRRLGVQLGDNLYSPAPEINDAVVEWNERTDGSRFVWVHYMDLHTPYYPHEGTVGEDVSRRRAVKLSHKVTEERATAPASDIETLEKLYRGQIEFIDDQIGDLLGRLEGTMDLDETLVVVGSDHGEAFDEHGHVFHPSNALYDENVHVPLILRGPDVGNGLVQTPVSNADIVPMLLSQAGIDPPASAVGTDVTRFLTDPPDERLVFAEADGIHDGTVMVTDGRYKLLRDLDSGEELLFDRDADPEETRDLSDEMSSVRRRLGGAVDEHLRDVEAMDTPVEDVEVSDEVKVQLRRLGYDE